MSPHFLRAFWLVVGVITAVLWPIATIAGWVNYEWFISHASMAALVLAAFGGWQSTRVEVRQEEDADVQEVLDRVEQIAEQPTQR